MRRDIQNRCESLEALQQVCVKLQSEITFRAPPISELIDRCAAEGKCAELFRGAERNMGSGFKESFRKSAEKWSKAAGLTQEETKTVQLLEALGSTDVEGEKRLLSEVAEKLSRQAFAARNELASRGRMLFSCSLLAGLTMVILII